MQNKETILAMNFEQLGKYCDKVESKKERGKLHSFNFSKKHSLCLYEIQGLVPKHKFISIGDFVFVKSALFWEKCIVLDYADPPTMEGGFNVFLVALVE